jgi:hypothetical protein
MSTHPHFEEFLRLLERNRVDYMIVGGYAVAFHGWPRFTGDIDVFYDAVPLNIRRLKKTLLDFGFPKQDIPESVFHTKGEMLTFGVPPVRVDLMNDIDGISFEDAKQNVVRGKYGKVEVNFIGLDGLLRNKRATNRAKDRADIEELTS